MRSLNAAVAAFAVGASTARADFVGADGSAVRSASPTREAPASTLENEKERAAHSDWLRLRDGRAGAVVSRSQAGREMDRVRLREGEWLRLVTDQSDRHEAPGAYRSLVVDFGGSIEALAEPKTSVRVLGPYGPQGALRLRLRAVVVRYDDTGVTGAGASDADAQRRLGRDLRLALAAWNQCGIGVSADLPIGFVPRPPAHLLAVGAGFGLPASGGTISFTAAGTPITVPVARGASALGAAWAVATAARKRGFHVDLAENERTGAQAAPSVDLSFRSRAGKLVELAAPGPVSTDATLDVRIGSVDLRDGLEHFREEDSQTGTLEERTLLRAVGAGDPKRVTLVLVPAFAGTGSRLGESFIPSDGSSLAPMVLVDQRGVSMGAASMVAPHELGHVLLDQPGHPDAFGTDTPTRLMDSDASDPSAYGPRRLTLDECRLSRERALARGLLEPWPVGGR